MYATEVDDRVLNFAVSGMLWQRSLVMKDDETGSLWSHLLGEAMDGPLKGTKLKTIPSVITDWSSWREEYPDTKVLNLPRTAERFRRGFHDRPERFVFGLVSGAIVRAWPLDQLTVQPIVNDVAGAKKVLIWYDKKSTSCVVFDRIVDGKELHFQLDGNKLRDRETKTSWNPRSGRAIVGPLAAKQLRPLSGILSFRRPWEVFHPDSSYWSAAANEYD